VSLYHRCDCPNNLEADCAHAWHYKFESDGRRIQKSTKQTSKAKAAQVELKAHARMLDEGAGLVRRVAPRLSVHLAAYLDWARDDHPATADQKAGRTLMPSAARPAGDRRYRVAGSSFLEVVGDKRLDHISAFDIERWRSVRVKAPSRCGGTMSRQTVNRELEIVRGVFSKAVEWKRLAVSPMAGVKAWKVDDRQIRPLTADERRIVLTQLAEPYRTYCEVTLEALLRIQEVIRLRRSDLGEASIQRRLKGGRVRRVPVSRALIATLRGYLRTEDQEYVFANAAGAPPNPRSVAQQMTWAFRAVGLPHIHHHLMRHTGVTDMLEDGINPKAIMEYAGWASLRMLERYGHVRDAELLRATAGTAARNRAAVGEAARLTALAKDDAGQAGPAARVGTKTGTTADPGQ
jgi:integrase